MTRHELAAALDRLPGARLLVLGDLILDRYTWGDAERVSQEAPVITLRVDRHEQRLGGAANVAHMLRGLDAEVTIAGVIGDDDEGRSLRQMLVEAGADANHVICDRTRPTTVKQRYIGRAAHRHPSQILRVDREVRDAIDRSIEEELIDSLTDAVGAHHAVLISDYGKGLCTPKLVRAVMDAAHDAGVPVVVDPSRDRSYEHYRGATAVTPNRLETETATGAKIIRAEDALPAGRQLCRSFDLAMALVTLDSDGMALVRRDGTGAVFPTQARSVYDVTGAGDIVLAVFGSCLASGVAPEHAVQLGNVAGALEVQKTGVAVVSREEIRRELIAGSRAHGRKIVSRDEIAELAKRHRSADQLIVFTNGCFDMLHSGHIASLQEAAEQGDILVVGLNSDESVRRLKGPARPVINQTDRATVLAALACVDYVVVFDEDTPRQLIQSVQPDVLVKGGSYAPGEIVGADIVTSRGGRVHVAEMVDGISTTRILESLNNRGASAEEPSDEQSTWWHTDDHDLGARWRRAG